MDHQGRRWTSAAATSAPTRPWTLGSCTTWRPTTTSDSYVASATAPGR
uniref:Uncharacterized protein n=1 Tax=Arundo donax TaxID=35708 RepID=A0A0A8ZJ74_ARUDO